MDQLQGRSEKPTLITFNIHYGFVLCDTVTYAVVLGSRLSLEIDVSTSRGVSSGSDTSRRFGECFGLSSLCAEIDFARF